MDIDEALYHITVLDWIAEEQMKEMKRIRK